MFVFLLISVFVGVLAPDIEKISNSIIRNGTTTYAYTGSSGTLTQYLIRIQQVIPPADLKEAALPANKPHWAKIPSPVDPTPDINVLDENKVRLYFTARDAKTNRTSIGAAFYDRLYPDDKFFIAFDDPVVFPSDSIKYNLTEPTLMKNNGKSPILIYTNGSHIFSSVLRDGLFWENDLGIFIEPSLDWEGGVVRSPRAVEHDGMYFIFYTAADGVSVGVARGVSAEGPYEKMSEPIGRVRKNIRDVHKDEIFWGEDGWPYLV